MRSITTYFLRIFLTALVAVTTSAIALGQGPVAASYNNMTARFNSYFYAKQRILEIEQALYDNYQWNYNRILPIFPQYDTIFSASQKAQVEDCIKKASISIQYHPGSRWEYDCYTLVGKARLYGSEFPEAIETFKYVNTKSDNRNERHAALVSLMRTFIEASEYLNAESASDYLSKQKLSGETLKRLYLNKAYLSQKRKDLNKTVENLVLAEALMASGKEKGRINFIIGQIYQQLGFDAAAYRYYRNSLKNGPEYELAFYTKLNMAQVTELQRSTDKRRIQKYFRKLLKDPKNREYQDKIYYEMGSFELKQGNIPEAIDYYKTSAARSVGNQRQKSYSYLKLSEIYYDSLGNYEQAKLYYDSTAMTMPPDEDNYESIIERQKILEEFVKHIKTIRVNDSLLALARLSPADQEKFVTDLLEQKAFEEEEKAKLRRKKERRALTRSANTNEITGTTISTASEGVWYFYNPNSVSRGRSEFVRNWGQRSLEDNWRRSNRASTLSPTETPIATDPGEEVGSQNPQDLDPLIERAAMLDKIPNDPNRQLEMLAEIEEAYYQVGNIYNFQLEEKQNATEAFEELLSRFDTTHYEPEVLYQLYLLYRPVDTLVAAAKAQNLLSEYPESVYAKLIFNPRYREENLQKNQHVQELYAIAYDTYRHNSYERSIQVIDSTLNLYEESDYHDNLALLRIINVGKTENIFQYQFELGNFIKDHSGSELAGHAEKLLTASREHQINLFSSSRGKYVPDFDQSHYFLLVYEGKGQLSNELPTEVENFLSSSGMALTNGNLVLDEKYSMVLVSDIPGKASSQTFLQLFQNSVDLEEKYKGENFYTLVITKDNFEILYESKDLRGYLNFFDKNYQ